MIGLRAVTRLGRLIRPLSTRARDRNPLNRPTPNQLVEVSEEVRDAVASGKPVVALESTIYTHGFPYPDNVALASLLESVVRTNGGVPATIAVFNGVARVGLNPQELTELACAAETRRVLKVSRRDLGYICGLEILGKGVHGGTTISGTMILAHLAGIRVFGTGGLGGVHRGGELSMDISADLTELGRTPVTVISSGCKSFLDIPRTLEYLETEGVCVGTFVDGRHGPVDFPAFFTRESGVKSPKVIKDEAEAAAIIYAQSKVPLSSGILLANPVPKEYSIPQSEMDKIITESVRLAEANGSRGSDNTPFVLAKIRELSGGKTVDTNKALVESNVKRATKVAVELAKLERSHHGRIDQRMPTGSAATLTFSSKPSSQNESIRSHKPPNMSQSHPEKANVLVAGSLAIDLSCDYTPLPGSSTVMSPILNTSNPANIAQSLGGVGCNVALAASYVGSSVVFCSVIADDLSGQAALSGLVRDGLYAGGVQVLRPSPTVRTAQYVAINSKNKELVLAMADMSIMELPEQDLNFDGFWEPIVARTKPNWVVVDANWNPETLAKWVRTANKYGARVAFEPVSAAKATRVFSGGTKHPETNLAIGPLNTVPNHTISLVAPNSIELKSMYSTAREIGLFDSPGWWRIIDGLRMSIADSQERLISITSRALVDEGIAQQSLQLLPFIPCILTKLGSRGVLVTQLLQPNDPRLTSPDSAPYIISRTPIEDSLVGGVYMRLFPPDQILTGDEVVNVNGAGDTLLGVVVAGLAAESKNGEKRLEDIIPVAQEASIRTLKSPNSVSPDITGLTTLIVPLRPSCKFW